ncbi:hypothetical protein [Spiroplasma citri]|uniref:Uncharacterized protein n=1 Tax=Spiroplasma citri TaxID=2133 RepID=A0AAJ4JXP6_SPICI|nr:hypothetical protein [Spiroplasma citri]APE74096.1 hypothetical protein SCITRI_00182 [Spiroplasma citri]QED24082.1 hypothetical protein FRX96_00785 [Spiroplasma citri]QIA66358.1 hypothetical protein GMI18_00845 [Spiroplasma citri]QIA68234.1 hypothetical protein GL298_00960 [Spiroplasma citri]QIA70109.1 hypothetical protein GL981_00965 [Spiroplasma citri]
MNIASILAKLEKIELEQQKQSIYLIALSNSCLSDLQKTELLNNINLIDEEYKQKQKDKRQAKKLGLSYVKYKKMQKQ